MGYPLFDRYPAAGVLPRAELCSLPTPLEPWEIGIDCASLTVKRDDLTSREYGGNKARKLELLLGEALRDARKAVITFGAYGSNHALATAVHACALGLEPHVVLSPQAPGPFAARTLRAHAGLGTVIHPVDGWDGSREAVRVRAELTERDGIAPAVIPMGGTNALGALAYVSAAFELLGQRRVDVVYVAGGTLGTAVGLALGFALEGADTRVQGVRVTPEQVGGAKRARAVAHETIGLLRSLDPAVPALRFDDLAFALRDEFFEPGYGVATVQTHEAVSRAAESGLNLETTYTGKAMQALLTDAEEGLLAGLDVVYWNTYSGSTPLPPEGPAELLPAVIREYVAECDRLFGAGSAVPAETEKT
jgi:1-aminocyclopropane-1-carboxylate deaminase/D-cysteine desulfhydrase-like pyridoxal-dependent ACC family enzyme